MRITITLILPAWASMFFTQAIPVPGEIYQLGDRLCEILPGTSNKITRVRTRTKSCIKVPTPNFVQDAIPCPNGIIAWSQP